MFPVIFEVVRVDEDVVYVSGAKDIEEWAKNFVDTSLEGRWCIGEAKRHNKWFEQAIAGIECGHPLLAFFYSDPIKGTDDV